MLNNPIVIFVLIGAAIVIILLITRQKHALKMMIVDGEVIESNGLTKRQQVEAEEFFAKHFDDVSQIRITAVPHSNRLKFKIIAKIDSGRTQQIRNFLVDIT